MSRVFKLRFIAVVFLGVLAVSSFCAAQTSTSSVTGTILDKDGKGVPDAKVTVKNEDTGVEYPTKTTSTGDYTVSSLVPGFYSVTVVKDGFRTYISSRNVLTVGAPLVVDATLQIGQVTETVKVESSYERIDTSSATVSDVMTPDQVKNLPLNGRNPLSLLTLEPGVVQRTFNGAGSGTHVFGSRDRAHNVTIDGIDANESTVPNPQGNIQRLNPDNVQEFRTVTLGATAENGRNSGANVMVGTKSGTNGFHGDAFYFNRNSAYASNEFFNNALGLRRPDLKLNQWGFDVGGPIIKNKTFFFGSYQGNNIKQSAPISSFFGTPLVYTSVARTGVFRYVRGTVTPTGGKPQTQNGPALVDSSGNLLPGIATCSAANSFSNCVDSYSIAAANDPQGIGFDPATSGLLKSLPQANQFAGVGDGLNTAGFAWNPPTKFVGPNVLVRVDHTFGPNDNLFVRWLQNYFNTSEGDFINARPEVFPGFSPLGEVNRIGKNLAISYRHTFSPTLVNELTLGFNRFAFLFTFGESNPGFGNPAKDPPWADQCVYGSFVNVSAPDCVSPHTARAVTVPQFIDNLTWTHGAHTFRAGINFRFYIHNDSRGFFGGTILAPGVVFNQGGIGSSGVFTSNAAQCNGLSVTTGPDGFTCIPDTRSSVSAAQRPSSTDISDLRQAITELAGIPFSINQSYRADFAANQYLTAKYATVYTRAHQYDSYIQDEWKLRPNLTLNIGLRWEFNPAPYDSKQSLTPNVFPDGSQGTVTFAKSNRWFANNNWAALAPRVGIAWSPDSKTSVRAGYALLFDTISTFQVTAIAGKMPGFMLGCTSGIDFTGTVSTTSGCVSPAGLTLAPAACNTATSCTARISQSFPVSIPLPGTTPSAQLSPPISSSGLAPAIGAFDQNMKNPSVHEWSLTIQRELPQKFVAEIGYIGKRGTHLQRAYDLNQPVFDQVSLVGSNKVSGFLNSFNTARTNFLAGCNPDGSTSAACPAGGTVPSVLLSLVTAGFINGQTTNLRRGDVGSFAAAMDALSPSSSQRSTRAAAGSPTLSAGEYFFRPNAQFGQIFYQDSGGDSYYHGLYIAAKRRFESGLDFGFSYTFSKSIDDMSVDPTGAATGGGLSTTSFSRTPTDVRNFRLDRSLSDFNNTHVFLANGLYEFPFGKGKKFASGTSRWMNALIGGWSLTGIYGFQSGEPYTISSGARTSNAGHNSTALVVGPNIRGGTLLTSTSSNVVGPVLYNASAIVTTPLNSPNLNCVNVSNTSTFFCIPPPGQNGSGRNQWQGPGFWNLDAGLFKTFDLTERWKLQLRLEAFNVLNHPNFENPRNATTGSPTITSTLFGQTCCATAALASQQQVNPVGEPMRVVQIGAKINF
jgi:hypothetical protein